MLFANVLPDVIEALGPDGQLLDRGRAAAGPAVPALLPAGRRRAATPPTRSTTTPFAVAPFVEDAEAIDLLDARWPRCCAASAARSSAFPRPRRASCAADPERVAHWRDVLDSLAAGPKVGVLWKSLKLNAARLRYFSPVRAVEAGAADARAYSFVNLQYGDCAAELAEARDDLGVDIWTPPGIDLKDDLDDVAALTCALDLTHRPGQRHHQHRRRLRRARVADLHARAPGRGSGPTAIPGIRRSASSARRLQPLGAGDGRGGRRRCPPPSERRCRLDRNGKARLHVVAGQRWSLPHDRSGLRLRRAGPVRGLRRGQHQRHGPRAWRRKPSNSRIWWTCSTSPPPSATLTTTTP